MAKFLLWCILLVLCWPLAILALVLYPIVWLLLLPFRIVGIAVTGVLDLIAAILFLPARVLRGPRAVYIGRRVWRETEIDALGSALVRDKSKPLRTAQRLNVALREVSNSKTSDCVTVFWGKFDREETLRG